MLKIKEALLNASKTLLEEKQIDYQLENNCYVTGIGYGESLAKYVDHLANEFKLDIHFSNLSDLLDTKQRVTIITFDNNVVIERVENANIIRIDNNNVVDSFFKALFEFTKQMLVMAYKVSEIKELENYVRSYSDEDLANLANDIEKSLENINAKEIDYIGEGYETTLIDFARIYNANNFGSFSSYENSEDYHHINVFLRESEKIYTPIIINSCASSVIRLKETVKVNDAIDRKMVIITDDSSIETKSNKIIIKKAEKPYYYSAVEGYAYLYLTTIMVNKINEITK